MSVRNKLYGVLSEDQVKIPGAIPKERLCAYRTGGEGAPGTVTISAAGQSRLAPARFSRSREKARSSLHATC